MTTSLPVINFTPLLNPSHPDRLQTAKSLLHAFQTHGFLYLTHHSIPEALISQTFGHSARFFSLPLSQKNELAWDCPESNRGYSRMGQEKVTNDSYDKDGVSSVRAMNPDLKESYEIGREGVEGMPNQWLQPAAATGREFRGDMLDFFAACKELHMLILRGIALGLGIDEGWFDGFTTGGDNTLRLLHYPAVDKGVFERNKGQVRAGAHTDYGSITLLFQDQRGGLQVQAPEGGWIDATPIEGSIVVNAGDLLARWSNDLIRSTVHRVVEPPAPRREGMNGEGKEEMYPARYSIAYFCNPDFDRFIDVVPGTVTGEGKKYEGVNSGEYLARRLEATYA